MAYLIYIASLLLLLADVGQAQTIQYRFWAGDISPYSFMDAEKHPQGDLFRVFQTLVERMGYKNKVEIVPWKRVLMETQKNLPIVFIPVARSPERENLYRWIEPLMVESFGVFGLSDRAHDLQDKDRVKSLRICMLRGSAVEALARRHQLERVELVGNNETCARLLRARRVDAWLAGKRAVKAAFAQVGYDSKDLITGLQLELWPLYLAASKAVPEKEVEKWKSELQKMKMDGTFDRLLN